MQIPSWSGCHIPIITPFKDDLSVDETGLRKLVNYYNKVAKTLYFSIAVIIIVFRDKF